MLPDRINILPTELLQSVLMYSRIGSFIHTQRSIMDQQIVCERWQDISRSSTLMSVHSLGMLEKAIEMLQRDPQRAASIRTLSIELDEEAEITTGQASNQRDISTRMRMSLVDLVRMCGKGLHTLVIEIRIREVLGDQWIDDFARMMVNFVHDLRVLELVYRNGSGDKPVGIDCSS